MSLRTLIEINHDFAYTIEADPGGFREDLGRYLSGGDRLSAEALERYGVRVIGKRHHADKFIVQGEPDGFPVRHLTPMQEDLRIPGGYRGPSFTEPVKPPTGGSSIVPPRKPG